MLKGIWSRIYGQGGQVAEWAVNLYEDGPGYLTHDSLESAEKARRGATEKVVGVLSKNKDGKLVLEVFEDA